MAAAEDSGRVVVASATEAVDLVIEVEGGMCFLRLIYLSEF